MILWNYIRKKMLEHPLSTVSENDTSMLYEDLCAFSQEYAKKLNGEYYGIVCNSEMAACMALLSCIAAGKPAVPLPVRYGKEICTKICDQALPPYVISDVEGELRIYRVDRQKECKKVAKDTAVILFTSGSTGVPKGIMLSTENLLCNVKDIMSYLPTSEKDTVLISRPLYHSSVLTGEFIVSLCAGANIVFSSEPFQPQSILELIDRYCVTVFGSTPTLITLLSRFIRRPENSTVNKLTISGECLTDGMAKSIRKAFPKADIYCGYGLSEASPRVAYLPPNLFDSRPTSAGIALPSVKLKIVRENGSDASLCEMGEVVVKGPNVMTGYLDDAERTKKVLKNGWLRTGDVGYVDNDRMLYIKGRKDDMIIRAGMNIYPTEIENALSKDERFHDVQVYGYSKNGTQEIAMSVSGDFKSTDQIMRACRELLPNYQLPSKIEIADDVERLSSGKRRRKKET